MSLSDGVAIPAGLAVLWAAVAIDPLDRSAHRQLAAELARAGDRDGAVNEYVSYVGLLLRRGELEGATAELDHAARTLGPVQELTDAFVRFKALLPQAHAARVTFHTCLHDDGEATWLQLEGGTDAVRPEKVRLTRGGEVLETRQCMPMPAGRKSHARPNGDSTVWVVLRAPDEMLPAIDRDEADDYGVEALVQGQWLAVDLEDSGCRFGMKRRETRSA
jgi:hypothetical protein